MANHVLEEKGGSYIQGEGQVVVQGDRVIITIADRSYADVPKSALPEGIVSGETYRVRLSGDGTELYSICPVSASVVVMFDRFASKKDEPPSPRIQKGGPREYNGKKWTADDKLVFTPILKVASKRFKGMEIPYVLDYTFRQFENTKDTVIPYGSKQKNKVLDFLRLFGWDDQEDVIPFSDNVLPFLQNLLHAKGTKVLATIKGGYISEISAFDPEALL